MAEGFGQVHGCCRSRIGRSRVLFSAGGSWGLDYKAGEEIVVMYADPGGMAYGVRDTDGAQGWVPACCVTPVIAPRGLALLPALGTDTDSGQ